MEEFAYDFGSDEHWKRSGRVQRFVQLGAAGAPAHRPGGLRILE